MSWNSRVICRKPLSALLGVAGIATLGSCQPHPASTPASRTAAQAVPQKVGPTAGELLKRSRFDDGRSLPWMSLFIEPAKGDVRIEKGAACLVITSAGIHSWDVQLRHREMTIQKGHTYAISFTAWSDKPTQMNAKVGMSGAPYRDYFMDSQVDLSSTPTKVAETFTVDADDDPTAEFAFHLGGDLAGGAQPPFKVCFDDLHLTDPQFTPPPAAPPPVVPAIRLNQLAFFTHGPKRATWVTAATSPAPFELVDGSGEVLLQGKNRPRPQDVGSGDSVQEVDFSSYQTPGRKLRLRIPTASAESDPFDVDDHGELAPLARDALRYFYLNRSGIPLEARHTEGPWARAAGHPTDRAVPCASDAGCSYKLDVSGGWYDAGDYGKYVVNGGLSVWLLMDLWELASQPGMNLAGLGDGALNIPESGNGRPDLLDEARWELDWILKMQVPEGQPHAGMAHHKMHDEKWTSLAVLPVLMPDQKRSLRPVSTAATLNLAAVAAQGARVFGTIDPPFARRCRRAAERAWQAAEKEPLILARSSDSAGGGAYEDDDVSDERFWAAAELYVTTGDERYRSFIESSPFHSKITLDTVEVATTISWQGTDALGMMSLVLGKKVPAALKESSRRLLVSAAETYVKAVAGAGYGQPFAGVKYVWGSNGVMVDNGLLMAFAHWLTKDPRFLDGAIAAMDYLLGRNAVGQSYVTGFGTRSVSNPHHRAWSHSLDPRFPGPPPGALADGANTQLQDPYAKAALAGCKGQHCYVDYIDAPSLNEVAINWNAALAWLATYLETAGPGAR